MLTCAPQSAAEQTKALPRPHWSIGNGHLASVQAGSIGVALILVAVMLAGAHTPNTAADPRTRPAIAVAVAPISARFIAEFRGFLPGRPRRLACKKVPAKPSNHTQGTRLAPLRPPACAACVRADGGARVRSRRRGYAA